MSTESGMRKDLDFHKVPTISYLWQTFHSVSWGYAPLAFFLCRAHLCIIKAFLCNTVQNYLALFLAVMFVIYVARDVKLHYFRLATCSFSRRPSTLIRTTGTLSKTVLVTWVYFKLHALLDTSWCNSEMFMLLLKRQASVYCIYQLWKKTLN